MGWESRHNKGVEAIPLPWSMVEMAGVEPASREFEQEHTTSLVDHLILAWAAAGQQASTQVSRCGAHSLPASGPTYRRLRDGTPGFLSPVNLSPGSGKGRT